MLKPENQGIQFFLGVVISVGGGRRWRNGEQE
jgi:hypothetical protein